MNKEKPMGYKIIALANTQTTELLIYGDIGQDFWADESNDAKYLVTKIAEIATPNIDVRINSNGGSVVDALAIYNALKRKPATVTCYIDGVAFSAASLIAMAGDTVIMAANALMMIHAPSTMTCGNAEQLRIDAAMLDKYADAMAQSYMEKSGKTKAEIDALLKGGIDHYYTAEEALSEGFINQIGDAITFSIAAIATRFNPPKSWIDSNKPITATVNNLTQPIGNTPMAATIETPLETPNPPVIDNTVTAKAKQQAETQRQESIKGIFALIPTTEKNIHALQTTMLVDASVTEDNARAQILAKMGENQHPVGGSHHVITGMEGKERFIVDATNAILAKASIEKVTAGNTLRGMSLHRLAEECLVQAHLAIPSDRMGLVAAAFTQSTSDFPILLENAINKTLLASYAVAPNTWSRFCAVGQVPDFRANPRYRTGSFGNLDAINELGEFKNKSIPDGEKSSITIGTKGNIINISRQAIINDDLGAFINLARDLARAAKRTIEQDVFSLLASNPTMGDGVALFHATHGNLGTASAVTMLAVDEGRQLMAVQKDISGGDYLELRPALWVGGMAQGGNARIVNGSVYDPDTANKLQRPNLVNGLFRDVIDTPRITGNTWYMFADPLEAPVIEVAFLDGNQEPYLEMMQGWNVDGTAYKVRLDYGVAAIDYRGAVKNVGA
jgi:ATP-dependent protease ClpP protease subunit